MFNLKPIKRTLRNASFVLDNFATHIDKKQLSFKADLYHKIVCKKRRNDFGGF